MLIASRDNNVKSVYFCCKPSTHGDNLDLPKIENKIGTTIATITKFVNEIM